MNDHDFQTMTAAMLQFGGSFVRDMASLMRKADTKNRARLIAAFDHLVRQYGPGSEPFAQMHSSPQTSVVKEPAPSNAQKYIPASDRRLSAEEFAKLNHVKAPSVRSRVCRVGHYFGVVPERLSNGRLSFPDVQVKNVDGDDGLDGDRS